VSNLARCFRVGRVKGEQHRLQRPQIVGRWLAQDALEQIGE